MRAWSVAANIIPSYRQSFPRCIPFSRPSRPAARILQPSLFAHSTMATQPPSSPTMAGVELITDQLDKPITDDRQYRVIRLQNQLEVLLASDPKVDMASAALDVNVGSFRDRDGGIAGLAHAVEHLLFMGSEKYPNDNDFKSFIGSHAGASNASTSFCDTVYHFQITADDAQPNKDSKPGENEKLPTPFYGAMDRFSQFFTSPLFLASTVGREINAVDSEFKLKYQSDDRRLFQLSRTVSNPDHPHNGFSTGNLQTLRDEPAKQGIEMRPRFVGFHGEHYSANRMKLCVLGKESLDILQQWVVELFSGIPNKDLPQNRWEGVPLWTPELLPRRIFTRPIMDSRLLRVQFEFLDEELLYENKPSGFLGKLLGHEGEGSLLAYLKDKSLAMSINAGAHSVCPGTPSVFTVGIGLTELGLERYEDVIKSVFQYISLLRKNVPQLEAIVTESQQLADLGFRFRQKTDSRTFTSSTAKLMQTAVLPKWYIGISNRAKVYDQKLMDQAIDLLRPEKTTITLVSQKYPDSWEKKEKWYGTEYTEEKLPSTFLSELNNAFEGDGRPIQLRLPDANPFIPENLDVEKTADIPPTPRLLLATNETTTRSWHKKDDTFLVPKATIYVTLHNPSIYATADNEAHADLLTELVDDALQSYAYAASLAGLNFTVGTGSRGFVVRVSGYNDKIPLLLDRVLAMLLRDLEIKQDKLDVFRERLLRSYKNSELQKPCIQIPAYEPWLLSADTPAVQSNRLRRQLVPGLEGATVVSLQGFRDAVCRKLCVEMYSHGNVTKDEAVKITGIVEDNLRAARGPNHEASARKEAQDEMATQQIQDEEAQNFKNIEVLIPRALVLPRGANYRYTETIRDAKDVNNCISYHIQLGPPTLLPSDSVNNGPDAEPEDITALRAIRAKAQLLCHIIRPRAFHQLRTTEQLGYVVRTRLASSPGARGSRLCGFAIEVQSEKTPEILEERIDAVLKTLADPAPVTADKTASDEGVKKSVIEDMTDVAFEAEKKGVVDKMLEKPKNMTQEGAAFWARIRDDGYDFEQAEKDAKHVMAITKVEFIDFIRTHVSPTSANRATLAVYLRSHQCPVTPPGDGSTAHGVSQRTEILDIRVFKAGLIADVGPRPVQAIGSYYY